MKYSRIEAVAEGNAAHFGNIVNFEDDFELVEGLPLADNFPENAEYRMNDDFPDNIELHDILHNLDEQLIINEKTRKFFENQEIKDVEYLPVNIINHKGRKVKEKYYIMNFLKLVDCIDRDQTTFGWNSLDPDLMEDVENLTVDESRIPLDSHIFRIKHLTSVILIYKDLLDLINKAGFKGYKISKTTEYEW